MTDSYSRRLHFSRYLEMQRCVRKVWLDLREEAKNASKLQHQQSALARYYAAQHQQLRQTFLDSLQQDTLQKNAHQKDIGQQLVRFIDARHFSDRCLQTRQSIAANDRIIVDASFESNDCVATVDILLKTSSEQQSSLPRSNSWELILVKAAASVKNRHIEQATFQYHVLMSAGIDVSSVSVVTANRRFRLGSDQHAVTRQHDITEAVLAHRQVCMETMHRCRTQLAFAQEPEATLGKHCFKRGKCAYYERCWQGISDFNLFMLPHLKPQLAQQLLARKLTDLDSMPPDAPLSDAQWYYVSLVKRRAADINLDGLQKSLASLQFPLFFLDFEADNAVIPRFVGQKTFAKTPFQFSCHRLDSKGSLTHTSYLHVDDTDPRMILSEKLLEALEQEGSIVVWHAAFERSRLHELAHLRPDMATAIQALVERLWDLEPVFKMYYQDYRFMGSSALKKITSVLLPELAYNDLAIADGETVVACWNEMICLPAAQRQGIYQAIDAYCTRDTLVMVKLLQYLQQRCAAPVLARPE